MSLKCRHNKINKLYKIVFSYKTFHSNEHSYFKISIFVGNADNICSFRNIHILSFNVE